MLLLLYYGAPVLWQQGRLWIQRYQTGEMQTLSGTVTSSLVYLVKSGQWVTFNIPEGSRQLRVISNAHITQPDIVLAEDNWKYILHYQLLDNNGVVLKDGMYHHRSKLSSYHDEQGKPLHGNFYAGYALTPLDGRLMLLSTPTIQKAASIRISLAQQSPEVEEVAIRLYVPAKIQEHRLAAMWLRMSNKRKEILAKNSVYPAALLSENEKRNLLKHQWQVQGPIGIEGEDYRARTLYILRELEEDKLSEPVVVAGLQIDVNKPGVIPIPEHGGDVQIQLSNLDGSSVNEPVSLQLNWFGRTHEQRWQRVIQWLPGTDTTYTIDGGLLEVTAKRPALVHVILISSTQPPLDITPKPLIITAYQAARGVDYQILHVDHSITPLRIDIRKIFNQDSQNNTATIEYQWLNKHNQLLDTGEMTVATVPSIYDRLSGKQKDLIVSDPVRYYMNVPAEVSKVRLISTDSSNLVNVYNQPAHYQKKQRIPENAYISLDKKNWLPSWFQMYPVNQKTLLKQQAVSKLAAQYRPPQDRAEQQSDEYLWQTYQPEQQTEARSILTVMDSVDYRDEALANVYCQLQPNSQNQVDLKSYGNLSQISPQLIYIRNKTTDFHVEVTIDDKLTLDRPAIGQQGVFRLANIRSGRHRILITTAGGGKWYLNHVSHCNTQTLLKKRVYKLANRQLTFMYNNEELEDKVFSGRFYTTQNNLERSVIKVSLVPLQEHPIQELQENWTFTQRQYDIRPAQDQPSIVLYRHGYYLNSGEMFFIPFHGDMPVGSYQIKLQLLQGASGYVSLSLVKPGDYEQIRFYRETNEQIQ